MTVSGNTFVDNQFSSPQAGAGLAVGMAHASDVTIDDNTFTNYFYSPIHVEDRSRGVTISSNSFSGCFKSDHEYASCIFVVNDSHDVTVSHNDFDLRNGDPRTVALYAGPGGAVPAPSDILFSDNNVVRSPQQAALRTFEVGNLEVRDNSEQVRG